MRASALPAQTKASAVRRMNRYLMEKLLTGKFEQVHANRGVFSRRKGEDFLLQDAVCLPSLHMPDRHHDSGIRTDTPVSLHTLKNVSEQYTATIWVEL